MDGADQDKWFLHMKETLFFAKKEVAVTVAHGFDIYTCRNYWAEKDKTIV
jgi:hypothetical protein